MPLYEYACAECGHAFEILQRLGEGGEGLACPRCQAERVEKQYSTFAASSSPDGGAAGACAPAGGGCGAPAGFT